MKAGLLHPAFSETMTTALADLVTRLQGETPTYDSVPTSDQYEQAVKDAVSELSQIAPLTKYYLLSVVNGTAGYTLPDDFSRMKEFRLSVDAGNGTIIDTANGALIPVGSGTTARYTLVGNLLTFIPTPTSNSSLDLWYSAKYLLNEDDEYENIGDTEARLVILKASVTCLRLQARKAVQQSWSYEIPEQKVDKKNLSKNFSDAADATEAEYDKAVNAYKSGGGVVPAFGMWSEYSSYDYEQF